MTEKFETEAIDLKETCITYNSRGWVRCLLGQFENKLGNIEESEYCYQFAIDDLDTAFKFDPKSSQVRAAFTIHAVLQNQVSVTIKKRLRILIMPFD